MPTLVAFSIGILVYLCYLYSQLRGDNETLGYFFWWTQKNSSRVLFGFFAYVILFVASYYNGIKFNLLEIFAVAWGPWSLLSAYQRTKNGKGK